MSVTDRNERRIARMSTWISHAEAEAISGEEEAHIRSGEESVFLPLPLHELPFTRADRTGDAKAHIRFLFYWIAYEAAYQMNEKGGSEKERRELFHQRLADHDWEKLQSILCAQKDDVVGILELRQAHPSFWQRRKVRKESKGVVETADAWNRDFQKWVQSARKRLDGAVARRTGRDEPHDAVWYQRKIKKTLNDLFENLSIVRHQIVHGGSAGPDSRGRTQVIRGAKLLSAFVPCFHDVIKANPDEDWGEPPFPRVGSGPDDDKCPPPWLS